MPSIKDIFRKKDHGDAATVLDLQRKVADLTLELNDTEHHARQVYLEAETNPALSDEATKAARGVQSIKDQIERATGALVEAEDRVTCNAEIAEDEAAATAWRKVVKLARARQDKGVEIDTLVLKLADAYSEMLILGEELYHAAPVRGAKLHNSAMAPANVEKALRLYLFKKGFKWSTSFPWNPDDIKPFSDVVKEGNTAVLAHRPQEETAA